MKKAKSITKHVRVSPYKARLAAGLIRGLKVQDALIQLKHSNLKSSKLLEKTLNSAIANAETQLEARLEDLKIDEVRVDGGPIIKRAKARSKGGRVPVNKRTSHFMVVVSSEK
ncbi:MAG: 50S ribosomal protein L22 [Candidatus Anoxychlamydiales bacterium]|nr:50S ribosomal protein L22 [Candidatus Anoxychlamydiales bacterium]